MNKHKNIYIKIREKIFNAIKPEVVGTLSKIELQKELNRVIKMVIIQEDLLITSSLQDKFVIALKNELLGLGPLQSLLEDESVSDILVNGPNDIYIEKNGSIIKTDITFIDEKHLLDLAKRIASKVGRRVDESKPICDARLKDGSRVNLIIPPVAVDGTSISIRMFKKRNLNLKQLVKLNVLSESMSQLLVIATKCHLNLIISGGTGAGKTTLLNALSQHIATNQRIITIEDTVELTLQQPHVVRLETRPEGIERNCKITSRDLVINALRMRPDRIIVGECRGSETFEMLQAMNTGHNGSMSTLHANTSRDALSRIENMILMTITNLPVEAIRSSIVGAIDLIVQINRFNDGSRKIVQISEIMGLEGNKIILEDLFKYELNSNSTSSFEMAGAIQRSKITKRAKFYGLEEQLHKIYGVSFD